jgi:protein gp37
MGKTKIEWCDVVWNPTVGCTKVSQGCKNCYAERIYERFHPGQKFSDVHCYPERLDQPFCWKNPRRVFVDSMSDLFHEEVPIEFISAVWMRMISASRHTFMILTKRPKRMIEVVPQLFTDLFTGKHYIPKNVWLGVSVEDQKTTYERIPWLLKTPAAIRFISVEPMLGEVNLDKHEYLCETWSKGGITIDTYLDWVICGCESGTGARTMELDWVRSLRDQCQEAGVPFFLKQLMIDGKLVKMPMLDGRIWDEIPKGWRE